MVRVASPLKWHGGKYYLAKKIIELMPPRLKGTNKPKAGEKGWLHYVEPYFGGGQVLFANDPEGISEVVSDINGELMHFWKVLRDPNTADEFIRKATLTPVSETLYEDSQVLYGAQSDVDRALRFFIRYRQSRQALGKSFVTLSNGRTRGGMNEQVSSWLGAVDDLPAAVSRLRRVVVLSTDALSVIEQQDSASTLYYLDPPYMSETRKSKKAYEFEMSEDEHIKLLEKISTIEGYFMLSGYRSKLYDEYADAFEWRRVDIDTPLNSSSKDKKERRTECVWMNYGI